MQDIGQRAGNMDELADIMMIEFEVFLFEQMFDIPESPVMRLSMPMT